MKFLLIQVQDVDGCGYTLGCGVSVETIEADSAEDVIELLKKNSIEAAFVDNYPEPLIFLENDERIVAEAFLVPIDAKIKLPIKSWRTEIQKRKKAEKDKKLEEKERKELERLAKKYTYPFGG